MSRTKPTISVDVIGNFDLKPENVTADYIESKNQHIFYIKPPNWDSSGESIELIRIHNERDHNDMLALQAEMLKSSKEKSRINASRVQRLYKMQAALRKRAIDVNAFIKECEDKKNEAMKLMTQEMALHEELHMKIETTQSSIKQLTKFRETLKHTVKEFEPYEKVLLDVVDQSDIFTSVKDCMDRCDALMLAQMEITTLENTKIHEIEEMRKRMVLVTNAAALTVLGMKNELMELQRAYAQAHYRSMQLEEVLSNAKDVVLSREMEKERTLDGIYHMYRMLCARRNMPMQFHRREVEQQLDFIKNEVEVLQHVLKECKKYELLQKRSGASLRQRIPC